MSPSARPKQRPGGGPGGKTPGSPEDTSFYSAKNEDTSFYSAKNEDTSFYSAKNGPKIDAFLLGYCSRNYTNWQTKNISENNLYILHKRGY